MKTSVIEGGNAIDSEEPSRHKVENFDNITRCGTNMQDASKTFQHPTCKLHVVTGYTIAVLDRDFPLFW